MKKRLLATLSALVMVVCMLPTAALAAPEVQTGTPMFTLNSSTVAFGGRIWYVIGDSTEGVSPVTGNITLLAASAPTAAATAFRKGYSSQPETGDYTQYDGNNWWYATNPTGTNYTANWTQPSDYAGSTLQLKMTDMASRLNAKESALVTQRNLTTSDGISSQGISGQKYWALSTAEYNVIYADTANGRAVLSNSAGWWLRSPDGVYSAFYVSRNGDSIYYDFVTGKDTAARPAFNLSLNSVLFISSASEGGKSVVTTSNGFQTVSATTGTIKFTMKDSTRSFAAATTAVNTTSTRTELTISYSGATVGTNEYVSAVIKNASGTITHYAKLVNPTSASGTVTLTLPADFSTTSNTVYVFSEQANDDLYTDFASTLIKITLTPTVTVPPTVYNITQGANGSWNQGGTSGLGFTANVDYSKFTGGGSVAVDGIVISTDKYTSASGSTIITLKPAYLETLTVGAHTLRINFTDGYAETTFTIAAAANPPIPATEDNSMVGLWIGLALLSPAGLAASFILSKKRRKAQ